MWRGTRPLLETGVKLPCVAVHYFVAVKLVQKQFGLDHGPPLKIGGRTPESAPTPAIAGGRLGVVLVCS